MVSAREKKDRRRGNLDDRQATLVIGTSYFKGTFQIFRVYPQ